jgi:acyl-CoA-binding protein
MADSVGRLSSHRCQQTANMCAVTDVRPVDRVFGHALNTVNKIRPGSQKPPSSDRLALYGLYKQSMEGDVLAIADRPASESQPNISADQLRKEQEKWDAWRDNEGLSRTEAKRRYVEKLIETMHKYASHTDEAKQLVEELEFVWDQIKSNSQHSSSEHSSPLQHLERSGYLQSERSGEGQGMTSSSAAAMESTTGGANRPLRILSPVSQADEEEALEEEFEEFVDAPFSQVDPGDLGNAEEGEEIGTQDPRDEEPRIRQIQTSSAPGDAKWRKRVENGLFKLTTEVAALREQLETNRFIKNQKRKSIFSWVLRLGWWVTSFVLADAAVLWIVILYMRRKQDRRLEGAVRVLLGDAVAQVQRVASDVKMPTLPKMSTLKGKKSG